MSIDNSAFAAKWKKGAKQDERAYTGSDLFKGNWNGDGTVAVKSDYAMVTFDTFLINQDATAEYALGTFYWISGETYRIALMRVREF